MAVQTCARRARCTTSFKARAATDAEKAVPLRIPRCSLDCRESVSILCAASAVHEGNVSRAPNAACPANTRMEGFPTSAPAR